jgi:integrase
MALRSAMVGWQTGGRTAEDNDFRQLLCDYVEFLLLTGCRHGTKAMGVSWQHCKWYAADGVKYLRVWIDGKTGGRWLIAKHELVAVLHRLHIRQSDIASKGFDPVLGRHKAYLFCTSDGRRPYSFDGLFRRLLRHCELLKSNTGETRTLYSLRHTPMPQLNCWRLRTCTQWQSKWELRWLCLSAITASSQPRWMRRASQNKHHL